MHACYACMFSKHTQKMLTNNFVVGYLNIDGNLTTKDSRIAWEEAFMTTYFNPVLSVSFYITRSDMHDGFYT